MAIGLKRNYGGIKKMLSNYEEIKIFEEPAQILGFKFRRGHDSPLDWCHPNPTFIIFRRKI